MKRAALSRPGPRQPVTLQKENPAPIGVLDAGQSLAWGTSHRRCTVNLRLLRGTVNCLKVEASDLKVGWSSNGRTSFGRAGGQSPRAKSPTRDERAPHRPARKRAGTYGWHLNIPLRQKNSGLNASPLTPAPVRTSRLWLPLAPVSPSLFGIRLPGYCLPLLFHMVVEFCAELPRPILLIMTYETPPFAFRVEAHPQQQGRYLWAIGYGFQTYRRSPLSFATRREAKNDALKAMSKIAAHWRRERDPSPVACDGPGGRLKRARPLRPQLSKNSPKVQ
jgi:hypothetical protein